MMTWSLTVLIVSTAFPGQAEQALAFLRDDEPQVELYLDFFTRSSLSKISKMVVIPSRVHHPSTTCHQLVDFDPGYRVQTARGTCP